ncbi:MAG: hypothetical protein V3S01_09290, partial [Dehalococcoidia bacterium]
MLRYTITIPVNFNDGKPVGSGLHQAFFHRACEIAGGATLHGESSGGWLNADHELISEPVRVL